MAERRPWGERRVILEGIVLIAALRLAVRMGGVRRVQQLLERRWQRRPSDDAAIDVVRQRALAISRLVDAASRHSVTNTCLHRSLALWWLLARRGIASEVRIGTRRLHGRFEAHAWVELAGVALNDRGEPGYAALSWPPVEREA